MLWGSSSQQQAGVPTGVMSNLNVRSFYCQVTFMAWLQFSVSAFVSEGEERHQPVHTGGGIREDCATYCVTCARMFKKLFRFSFGIRGLC